MKDNLPTIKPESSFAMTTPAMGFGQWKSFLVATAFLVVCFCLPLYHLAVFAWGSELDSYILLVPFIAGYLIHMKREDLPADSAPWRGTGMVIAAAGMAVLAGHLMAVHSGSQFATEDDLTLAALALLLSILGAAFMFLGRETMRACAFPLAMLVFIVPMPVFLREGIETFLQYGSAYAADGMFRLSGMPFFRDDLIFNLPVLPIRVAPECSGIHSTLILFLTSLIAGYLFLRSPRSRTILALAVLPLALLRNGFRIFTIGQLCVHFGPQMIDSPIHHKGGPIFFALSLMPFFALLTFLYRSEARKKESKSAQIAD
ncbi:MAG: exosortase VPDSG-CTERM-specific [Pedosphaera sp.]|nr:exosortase VPDSG-CTERM-specific [Pedosphaera sp.]